MFDDLQRGPIKREEFQELIRKQKANDLTPGPGMLMRKTGTGVSMWPIKNNWRGPDATRRYRVWFNEGAQRLQVDVGSIRRVQNGKGKRPATFPKLGDRKLSDIDENGMGPYFDVADKDNDVRYNVVLRFRPPALEDDEGSAPEEESENPPTVLLVTDAELAEIDLEPNERLELLAAVEFKAAGDFKTLKSQIVYIESDIAVEPTCFAPFTLERGESGARIYRGYLYYAVSILRFRRFEIAGEKFNGLVDQSPVPELGNELPSPMGGSGSEGGDGMWTELGWWDDVYLKWHCDPQSGEVSEVELVGPEEPEGEEIGSLDEELSRESQGENAGTYWIRIGAVPESKTEEIDQERTGNVPWFITLVPEAEESSEQSSEESSEASSGQSAPSSGETSSEETSSVESGSEKSTAIVPASWTAGGYVALFTMEAPDVRFEDVFQDLAVTARETRFPIDPRFVEVCEAGTIRVVGVVGDRPYMVGATIDGGEMVLHALADARRRPRLVNVKISAIRRGFRDLRFPNRRQDQFEANEKHLNSAYPA